MTQGKFLKKQYNFTLSDIEQCLQQKSWWAALFVLPIARRISLFLANYTNIRPNTITILSFIFVLLSAYYYSRGSYYDLLFGALFFEINYMFDCVDGTIARLKKIQSDIGQILDWLFDRLRIILITTALAYGQYKIQLSMVPFLLAILYLGLNNLILMSRAFQFRMLVSSGSNELQNKGVELLKKAEGNSLLAKWIQFTTRRNFMPYYHDVETDAMVFVLGPLLYQVNYGMAAGSVMAFILVAALHILFLRSLARLKQE